MSSTSGKVIGGPFSDEVVDQLAKRSLVFSKSVRTNDDIKYIAGRTGWVKLSSGVNLRNSSQLAQDNILIGGTKGRIGVDTYDVITGGTGKGFRPMPGITGVTIRSLNRFGVLKEATVTFNCWDVAQLEELELLYMRPGFTALLEWGHSIFLKGSGDSIEYDSTPETVGSFFNTSTTKEAIYAEIEELKKSSGQNYDGILGFVKNFSWSYRSDGGYDCTTSLVSIGEIIESLAVDIDAPAVTEAAEPSTDPTKTAPATILQSILRTIRESETADAWETVAAAYKGFVGKYEKVGGRKEIKSSTLTLNAIEDPTIETPIEDAKFTYISLRTFCEILNGIGLVDNNHNSIIKLNTNIAEMGKGNSELPYCRFRTYKFHTSVDPGVCILLTPGTKNWAYPESIYTSLYSGKGNTSSNEILNIQMNVDYLYGVVGSLLALPKEERTLNNLFTPIFLKLNDVMGGINDINFHYEEPTFTYYIIDRQVQVKESEISLLNITGLKSTVTKFDFTTKLSPALTTMIAISAQAGAADVGIEAEALLRWNKGLTDRVIKTKSSSGNTKGEKGAGEEEDKPPTRQEQQQSRRDTINQTLGDCYNASGLYIKENIDLAKTQYTYFSTTYLQFHEEESEENEKAGPAGIIPFEINIEMDGISGIKVGQAFQINESIMPHEYNGVIGFIVTGIDHSIASNRWTTSLRGQTIVLKGIEGKTKASYTTKPLLVRELPTKEKASKVLTKKNKRKLEAPEPSVMVTREMTDFATVTKAVIANLEGGYYGGTGVKDKRYGNSGETMFGIDRKQKGTCKDCAKFWALIDANSADWPWLYVPKDPLKTQLFDLVVEIQKTDWNSWSKRYLNAEVLKLVVSDGRLYYNMVYAVWNGLGWFIGFSKILNEAYKNGAKTSDALLTTIVNERKAGAEQAYIKGTSKKSLGEDSRSLMAQGGAKIAKAVGLA
jgi:hypothetical protein